MTDESPRRPVLAIRDLVVEFDSEHGTVHAVNGVDFDLFPGEMLAIVGETGSGKTATMLAALGLHTSARIARGSVELDGQDLLRLSRKRLRQLLGSKISMIFQDPVTALNPVLQVGWQIIEVLLAHQPQLSKTSARDRAIELLDVVGLSQPDVRYTQYPHQLSGGMCQRVMIAMAIANDPVVLVADEPTTGLDVTIQAQILDLLQAAQQETGAATILITHNLGVVAETADRVCVMYGGRIVEVASVDELFSRPAHPYSEGLLSSLPAIDSDVDQLNVIPGEPPTMLELESGCAFQPRCPRARGRRECVNSVPVLRPLPLEDRHLSACHFRDESPRRVALSGSSR